MPIEDLLLAQQLRTMHEPETPQNRFRAEAAESQREHAPRRLSGLRSAMARLLVKTGVWLDRRAAAGVG